MKKQSKFKNPIKLMKEPVRTMADVEARKADIKPWLILSAVLCLVGIGIIGLIYFGFLSLMLKNIKKKFELLTCNKCNEMATFETTEKFKEYVKYEVSSNQAEYNGVKHPASQNGTVAYVHAKAEAKAVVNIDMKCPHCGEVKHLEYYITPFKCSIKRNKVGVLVLSGVKAELDTTMKEIVNDYNIGEPIPYTMHSVHHPRYEERSKPHLVGAVYAKYKGATIEYHREVDELVEGYFVHNEINGTLIDPNKSTNKKTK